MARTIYGAEVFRTSDGSGTVNIEYDAIGKNSEVFAQGDIVGLASGLLLVTTTTMVGVVVKTQTVASDNQTVAKVKPGYIPLFNDTLFLMGANSDLSVTAGPGTYYPITGATGAQQIDVDGGVATGATRNVEIVQVDPFNDGGTGSGSGLRIAVVRILKTPYQNVTLTA